MPSTKTTEFLTPRGTWLRSISATNTDRPGESASRCNSRTDGGNGRGQPHRGGPRQNRTKAPKNRARASQGLTRTVPLNHHLAPINLTWKRTLRTASSERFLAQRGGDDVAAVDLHYLANGTIAGTVIILKGSGLDESNIQPLLSGLEDEPLPDLDLEHTSPTPLSSAKCWGIGRRRKAKPLALAGSE